MGWGEGVAFRERDDICGSFFCDVYRNNLKYWDR